MRNHNESEGWLEARTGRGSVCRTVFMESIPGGARWRYVYGAALAGTFLTQLFTGLLLMSSYVPSASQAWGSVWYIQNQMTFGWFIRGLHHFGSSAMMVLLLLHLLQGIVTAAYRIPREVNWWLGLGMAGLVFGLALTGYLLPWDQKGYWATKVATNIAGSTPVLGPYILKVLVGGTDYGNLTLTRLFSLHVGFLPLGLLVLLLGHVILYYRHGASAPSKAVGAEKAWPGQVFRNLFAYAVVLAVLVGLVLWNHGANLEAPADPSSSDYPARPEWYFLPLFQMLNYFKSPYEVMGTHVFPTVLLLFLASLPILERLLPKRLVYWAACAVMGLVMLTAGYLMTEAVLADQKNESFLFNRAVADGQRERATQLASVQGVPPDGAVYLLRRDPWTHGQAVLDSSCLSCHYFGGKGSSSRLEFQVTSQERAGASALPKIGGLSEAARRAVAAKMADFQASSPAQQKTQAGGASAFTVSGKNAKGEAVDLTVHEDGSALRAVVWSKQSASDLKGFGTKAWVRGLLEDPSATAYFGAAPSLEGMKTWKKGSKLKGEELDKVADFVSGLAQVKEGQSLDDWYDFTFDKELADHPGLKLFKGECGKCHIIGEPGFITDGGFQDAPDLYGYGSRLWLERMINNPADPALYGYLEDEDRMPAFEGQLSENDMDTLVRFIEGDYEPVE